MISTRRLVIATTSMTLAVSMPWHVNTALAGGKDAPADVLPAEPTELPPAVEVVDAPVDVPDAAAQDEPQDTPVEVAEKTPTKPSSAHLLADPKPLSDTVKKGLRWLASQQLDNGGWGQGEESAQMRGGKDVKGKLADTANVGDTCAAALTLLRSGSTPSSGNYDVNLQKALGYVCESVEAADEEDLYVTAVRNTRLQSKLGTYVDTFLAAQFLSEVKGKMASEKPTSASTRALTRSSRRSKNTRAATVNSVATAGPWHSTTRSPAKP